jgi:glucose/arabinose dehydrogenase
MFPEQYRNNIFLAEHGSWNRSTKIGYRVSLVEIENSSKAVSYETFANGWLDEAEQKAWGRPVDVLMLPDGSMLVSDDYANVVYRIYYQN